MNRYGYSKLAVLLLGGSLAGAAQEPGGGGMRAERCFESKVKNIAAGVAGVTESKFVPVRSTAGDLNADGRDEEIVLVRYVGTSGPRPDEILICEIDGEFVRAMTRLKVGRAGEYVLSVKSFDSNFNVKDGLLVIDVAVREDKKADAPKQFRTVWYRWDGKGLVESGRSEPKPLPEHMREIG